MKDRIARSVFWMVWSRGGIQVLTLLSTLFVARRLSPHDYGLMALAGIWIGVTELLAEMGLGSAIVQFRDLESCELNSCFWVTMTAAVALYSALFAAAPFIAQWFSTPALSNVLRVAGLSLPLVAIRVIPDGLLRKRLALDKIAKAEIAGGLIAAPLTVMLAYEGAGVWTLVAGALSLPFIQTIVTFWFAAWMPGAEVTGGRVVEILRYSVAALGQRVLWAVLCQTDAFVLGKISGGVVLGFYSMALRLGILPASKVTVAANQLAIPILAEYQSDREAMRASFLHGLRLVTCLVAPLCIGAALVAPDLIPVVLTNKWLPAVPLLQILAVFGLIRSVSAMLPPVLFARYRVAYLFWWTIALLAIMTAAFVAGAYWLGAVGVALSWAVVYPIALIPMAHCAFQEMELSWKTVLDQLRPVLFATLTMTACVLAVDRLFPVHDSRTRLARLIVAVAVGALVYSASIFRQSETFSGELTEVANWIIRRSRPLPSKS